jgi:hypothetical protein
MRKNENMPGSSAKAIFFARFPSIANRRAAQCKPNNDGQNLNFVP